MENKKGNLTYQPARFTDDNRCEKIQQILPKIKLLFEKEFLANHFPGLVYGVIVDGKLIDTQSFGYSDLERQISVSSQSLFRIASMTKSFTAMAIVKLRDDGKLRLDDSVTDYIPELEKTDMLTIDAPTLTIRHLLTQDVGMPEDDPWADRQLAINDDEFLNMLNKGISLSNPPGTVWEYTNLGYSILGRIITIVSGRSYQRYIEEEILRPLGMTNTVWEFSNAPDQLLARGYRWEAEHYKKEEHLHDGVYGAMGGLISSIDDFSKYVAFHLQAWPARNDPEFGPLRRSSLREMHHPWNFIDLKSYSHRSCTVTSAYCYGLIWSKNSDGVLAVNHTGGLPGFGSNWIVLPEHGIGLLSFANSTYADMCRINTTILDKVVTETDLKPRELPVSQILVQRYQQLTSLLIENQWNIDESQFASLFSENFVDDQSLELRKKSINDLYQEIGQIKNVGSLIAKNQLRAQFFIEGENGTIEVQFSLSPQNPPLVQELKLKRSASPSHNLIVA